MIFHRPTEMKHLRAVFCHMQKDATLGQAPRWLFQCSFPGSYYCWEETDVLFSFSFSTPRNILRPPLPGTALPNWLMARSCQQLVNWGTTASAGNVAPAVVSEQHSMDGRLDKSLFSRVRVCCVWTRAFHSSFV
jgi:hypothetical protein